MNVADTKPYNADFDGDEMNLHMPQDDESEMELKNLAAVPYQLLVQQIINRLLVFSRFITWYISIHTTKYLISQKKKQ